MGRKPRVDRTLVADRTGRDHEQKRFGDVSSSRNRSQSVLMRPSKGGKQRLREEALPQRKLRRAVASGNWSAR